MKGKIALMLALLLGLTGCSTLLERDYDSVRPHTSQYWEDGASILRVEDYQSLVNGLLMLVTSQAETGVARLYGYADQSTAVADMERACAEVTLEDSLGAYMVEYVTFECSENTNWYEMSVKIHYQRTATQLRNLVSATTAGALPALLEEAVKDGRTELAVRVGYMDRSAGELEAAMAEIMEENGRAAEDWSVAYYPDAGDLGDNRIVEITWAPPHLSRAALP